MSAKHLKKKDKSVHRKAHRTPHKRKRGILWVWVVLILLAAVLAAALAWGMHRGFGETEDAPDPAEASTAESSGKDEAETSGTAAPDRAEEISVDLGQDIWITDAGSYTGIYMEDGSDELVSDVMMIVVTNTGAKDLQYAEISIPVGTETAQYAFSTLPAGASVVVLEKNRMAYSADAEYAGAVMEHAVWFSEPLSLHDEQLKLQVLDGAMNVTNISGADITGDIVIYYKNSVSDLYYGGITYRVRLEGGIQANAIRQIMADHFSDTGSEIMFVTVG